MTKHNGLFSKKVPKNGICLKSIERIKIRRKFFRVIAYKLIDGEIVITIRQMAISVKKTLHTAKEFMRKMKIRPIKVQMPNRSVTDMIPLSVAVVFWKYLNESGKGNSLSRIGQEYLDEYLTDSLM
ncbi:hypothetical protein CK510_20345 [Brunnivagina elsteri CCALA 953]|uniref:Uncharacterized protein n=2 Tax=Brunnivagina TaxID=3344733 RepID=A0A2A2TER5_9CYAN|nr:hypothetical protein CK510_20345 [Calothrix elsteri CCALA 953]